MGRQEKKQLSKSVVFDPELEDKVICCVASMKVHKVMFHLVIMVVMGCCKSHSFFKKKILNA